MSSVGCLRVLIEGTHLVQVIVQGELETEPGRSSPPDPQSSPLRADGTRWFYSTSQENWFFSEEPHQNHVTAGLSALQNSSSKVEEKLVCCIQNLIQSGSSACIWIRKPVRASAGKGSQVLDEQAGSSGDRSFFLYSSWNMRLLQK